MNLLEGVVRCHTVLASEPAERQGTEVGDVILRLGALLVELRSIGSIGSIGEILGVRVRVNLIPLAQRCVVKGVGGFPRT